MVVCLSLFKLCAAACLHFTVTFGRYLATAGMRGAALLYVLSGGFRAVADVQNLGHTQLLLGGWGDAWEYVLGGCSGAFYAIVIVKHSFSFPGDCGHAFLFHRKHFFHSGKCTCYVGYAGGTCSLVCPTGTNGAVCSGLGTCNATDGACACAEGYAGPTCAIACRGWDVRARLRLYM